MRSPQEDDHPAWTPSVFDRVPHQAGQTGWRLPSDKPMKVSRGSRCRKSIIDQYARPRGTRLPLPALFRACRAPSVQAVAGARPEPSIHGIIRSIV